MKLKIIFLILILIIFHYFQVMQNNFMFLKWKWWQRWYKKQTISFYWRLPYSLPRIITVSKESIERIDTRGGEKNNPIIYQAAENQKVIISGAEELKAGNIKMECVDASSSNNYLALLTHLQI